MESHPCPCGKASPLKCGLCQVFVCKPCAQFLDASDLPHPQPLPSPLLHQVYCPQCFAAQVEPELARYQDTLAKARDIQVYEKAQSKETRYMNRKAKPVQVQNFSDYQGAILHLAFQAAQLGFSALIDVEIKSSRAGKDHYLKTVWSGSGIPSDIQAHQIIQSRSIWQNPN